MPLHAVPQLGFDEVQVTEPALERALEARHERRLTASEARRLFNEAHEAATAEVAKLELPEGGGRSMWSLPRHEVHRARA